MERFKFVSSIVGIGILVVISIYMINNIITLNPKGGESIENSLAISKEQEIDITVDILKGEYLLDFYYYWDDPSNKVDLKKGMLLAKGTTKIPNNPGIHKLVIVRGMFSEKHEYYYKSLN